MKNPLLVGVLVLIVLGAVWWMCVPTSLASKDYLNATYIIDGTPITLVDGRAETSAAPGSASKIVTQYFGNDVIGDLNGDGISDIGFIITQSGGGSGTFYYAVVALKTSSDGYVGTNAILLGDRIAPQTNEIDQGQLVVNYADRAPNDPMSAPPSLGTSARFVVQGTTLVSVPVSQDVVRFMHQSPAFSLQYPRGYTPDTSYAYEDLGPGKTIAGMKFTIDPALATSTNLGTDSYLSVESLPQTKLCTADLFLGTPTQPTLVSDDGVRYSVASSTGAGAGNRYEETVYAMVDTHPCIAIRYFIHWGVFENYPAGSVTEFDHAALLSAFDAIRRTIQVQ